MNCGESIEVEQKGGREAEADAATVKEKGV